jgi:hypothetical protein
MSVRHAIADIAILAGPENQVLWDEAEAFDAIIENASALHVGGAPPEQATGYLLSLSGRWARCTVENYGALWLAAASEPIAACRNRRSSTRRAGRLECSRPLAARPTNRT